MNENMKSKLEQFEQNRASIKKTGILMDVRIAAACACMFAINGEQVDEDKLKSAKALLKSRTGLFSNFRGHTETAVNCMLAGKDNAEELLDSSLKAYECLKKKFIFKEYLPMAAVMTAQTVPEGKYEEIAERTHRIYKLFKKQHPMLTGEADELMCVLLALQDTTVKQQAENCEKCYKLLNGQFGMFASKEGIQSLSQVLAAAGENLEENCRRATELYRYFKNHNSAMSNGYELGALGALAILPNSIEELGEQVLEINEVLKEQKGYNPISIDRRHRMIHSILLAATDYTADENGVISAIQGTIATIIMEEIMIICMIAVCTAAHNGN